MNIVVLVKQVPDSEAMVQVKTDGSGVEVEDRYTLNFFDSLAIEEALRIKEQVGSGTVTVVEPSMVTSERVFPKASFIHPSRVQPQ